MDHERLPGMAWCRKPVLGEGLGVVLVGCGLVVC